MKTLSLISSVFAVVLGLISHSPLLAATPEETKAIAKEAWIYAFPMMESYNTWYPQAVLKDSPTYVGGFNVFRHYSKAFTAANHDVVTPNNDTPYSWSWIDLRAEPIVISVPEVPDKRYYVIQCIDLYTYNSAYMGSRTTGNEAGDFLMVGPQWKGEIPAGFKKVFKSETEIVGTLVRTQLDGPEDEENVKQVQAGYKLTPLSAFKKTPTPPAAPSLNFPPYDKAKAASHDFIGYLNFFLSLTEPPHPAEAALRKRFAEIGIAPGKAWDASKVDAATLAAIDAGVKEAQAELKAAIEVTHGSNGLFGSREVLGENYLKRATAAAMGLYGNDLEEAWYGGFVGDGRKPGQMYFTINCRLRSSSGRSPSTPCRIAFSMTTRSIATRSVTAPKA